MSVFLDNQINYCKVGLFVLNNLSTLYERCANSALHDPVKNILGWDWVTMNYTEAVSQKKARLFFYDVGFPKHVGKPPNILLELLNDLPSDLKNSEAIEVIHFFYYEVMKMETISTLMLKNQGDEMHRVTVAARDSIITKTFTQAVIDSCDVLEMQGIKRARIIPAFNAEDPREVTLVAKGNEKGQYLFFHSCGFTIERKLKSLVVQTLQPTQEFALQ